MSLLQPDSGLLFWMLLSFGILFLILKKYGFPVITKMVTERKDYINQSLAEAKEVRRQMEQLKSESEAILKEAYQQQNQIVREGNLTREQLIAEAREEALKEKQQILDDARLQIEAEKKKALHEIRSTVVTLSTEIAEQILRKEFKYKERQKEYAKKILDEISITENDLN